MKKSLVFLFSIFLIGCKGGIVDEFDVNKFEDVSNLFVINPSEVDKTVVDEWVNVSARNIYFKKNIDEKSDKYFIQTSPTFYFENVLPLKKSRNVVKKIKEVSYKVEEKQTFKDPFDDNRYFDASVVYEGEFCYLWVEDDVESSNLDYADFANRFDNIYKKQTNLAGEKFNGESVWDDVIFPNKKISIILYDLKDSAYVGVFDPDNYNANFGSSIEAIFVDIKQALNEKTKSGVFSTICHEFSHLLTHVNKYLKKGLVYETWYTELLAMVSEDFFKDELDVSIENSPYAKFFLFVNYGSYVYGFKNWQKKEYVSNSYANAYTFGAFLARNYGWAELFYEIFNNDFVNEESIVNAVNKVNNLNITFNDLLKNFCYILANLDNNDKSLPSLNREHSSKIGDFTYYLSGIGPDDLPENLNYEVKCDSIDSITNNYLGSYGFNYIKFDSPTDVGVSLLNDDLIIEYN